MQAALHFFRYFLSKPVFSKTWCSDLLKCYLKDVKNCIGYLAQNARFKKIRDLSTDFLNFIPLDINAKLIDTAHFKDDSLHEKFLESSKNTKEIMGVFTESSSENIIKTNLHKLDKEADAIKTIRRNVRQ